MKNDTEHTEPCFFSWPLHGGDLFSDLLLDVVCAASFVVGVLRCVCISNIAHRPKFISKLRTKYISKRYCSPYHGTNRFEQVVELADGLPFLALDAGYPNARAIDLSLAPYGSAILRNIILR